MRSKQDSVHLKTEHYNISTFPGVDSQIMRTPKARVAIESVVASTLGIGVTKVLNN